MQSGVGAVKAALSNPDNYKDVQSDDDKMTADYNAKHSIHWSITGAINQGKNSVGLAPVGATCEMSVVSMYSGLSHNDQGDFKKRVDEALAKLKDAPPSQTAKPEAPGADANSGLWTPPASKFSAWESSACQGGKIATGRRGEGYAKGNPVLIDHFFAARRFFRVGAAAKILYLSE